MQEDIFLAKSRRANAINQGQQSRLARDRNCWGQADRELSREGGCRRGRLDPSAIDAVPVSLLVMESAKQATG